jgi:hypothetical protein
MFWLQTAEVLKGGKINNFDELEGLCLKVKFDLNNTISGFGRSISQICQIVSVSNPYAQCSVTHADPGTDTAQFGKKIYMNFQGLECVYTCTQSHARFL